MSREANVTIADKALGMNRGSDEKTLADCVAGVYHLAPIPSGALGTGRSGCVAFAECGGTVMNLIHTLFEPAGDGPHPTIVALHGWGANALDLLGLAPYIAGGKFMVICPQGPLEVPKLVRSTATDGFRFGPARRRRGADRSRGRSRRRLHRRRAGRGIRSIRASWSLLGFSQGGMMAFRLAFRKPEKFAALVGISTWFPPS